MGTYTLTPGDDTVIATDPANIIYAPTDTLTRGDIIIAPSGAQTTLVLENGNRFDLSAPLLLQGIQTVTDQTVGNSVITLRAGLDLTLQLGRDNATVYGADNADTIICGTGGYDDIHIGGSRESVIAGPTGATIQMDIADAGAHIAGGGNSVLQLTGAREAHIALGPEVSGIAELDIASRDVHVDVGTAGVATIALSARGIDLASGAARLITDYSGGNVIHFSGPGQTLRLPNSALMGPNGEPADRLIGFGAGDTIDVDLPYSGHATFTYTASTGRLLLSDGNGAHQSLYLTGQYDGVFQLTPDLGLPSGDYGTAITFVPEHPPAGGGGTPAPCFAAGTRVLTPRGPVAVEHLQVGDRLVTITGARRLLRWIGRRRIDCRGHAAPELVQPVRILADAFGPGLPGRDVVLSPDHALYLRGALIPVKYLVNGATIRRETVAWVTYFHLELASHDVVLAEDLPVETYLDTGNRHQFNDAEGAHASSAPLAWQTASYAPLRTDGEIVRDVRAQLLNWADLLGHRMTHDPDLHLRVDGQRVWGRIADGVWSGWVPPGARHIAIVSRAAAPADCELDQEDRRVLGVAISRLALQFGGTLRQIAADDPALSDGFYPAEADAWSRWRWTNGAAVLPPALWADIREPFRLDIALFRSIAYRLDAEIQAAPAPRLALAALN